MNTGLLLCFLFLGLDHSAEQNPGRRVLVFSETRGFRHESIPTGIAAIQKLGRENEFTVDTSSNSALFTDVGLKNYNAVIFLSTTGDILDEQQQGSFQRFIRNGGGFVGIHAAADTEYDWPWYNELVGGYFLSHPKQQRATILVVDKSHASTRMLPDEWKRRDEWYNYKNMVKGLNILCKLDESSYSGGQNGADHPFAWYREFDGGRTFYTGGGHTEESYSEPLFLQHILGGIKYAIGED